MDLLTGPIQSSDEPIKLLNREPMLDTTPTGRFDCWIKNKGRSRNGALRQERTKI